MINPLGMMALKYKLLLIGLAILALLWLGRQWLISHDNRVAQETREEVTETERVKAEAAIKAERELVAKDLLAKQAEIDKLNEDLTKVYRSLDNALKVAKQAQERNTTTVLSIPDNELNGAIRAELYRQRTATTGRTAPSPAKTP